MSQPTRCHLIRSIPFLCAVLLLSSGAGAAPGDLDMDFGTNGILLTDVRSGAFLDNAFATALQRDGSILIGGTVFPGADFVVRRYDADGEPDTGFGTNGQVRLDFSGRGSNDLVFAIAIQEDGKIVVVGGSNAANPLGFGAALALARFMPDGSLDPTFGNSGKVLTVVASLGGTSQARDVAIQMDGKILIAGVTNLGVSSIRDFLLARYNPDGSLDTSFGMEGIATTDVSGANGFLDDNVSEMALLSDGSILVAGTSMFDFALVRYTSAGLLDEGFGTQGKVFLDVTGSGKSDFGAGLAIQQDGKIVMVGLTQTDSAREFVVARFNADGTLDPAFSGGVVRSDFAMGPTSFEAASDAVIQPNGSILVGGSISGLFGSPDFALVLYGPNGALDHSFGQSGVVKTDVSGIGSTDGIQKTLLQPDGKLLVEGISSNQVTLARYLTEFSQDVEPPVLSLPDDIATDATSPAGAVVAYVVTAVDNLDPAPDVSCEPPSGSTFPIGNTSVFCRATDDAGNSSEGEFTITVKGAVEQLTNLIGFLNELELKDGIRKGLLAKVNAALKEVTTGETQAACDALKDFLNHTRALAGKKFLAPEVAASLIQSAERIRAVLDCPA